MKNKVIKVISLLTAIVTLFSFAACGDNKDDTTTTEKAADAAQTEVITNEDGETEIVTVEDDETTEDEKTEENEVTEDDKSEEDKTDKEDKTTKKNTEKTTKEEKTTKKETTTKKEDKTTTKKQEKEYSKAEIVKICTDAINKAKKESPGYTKHKYQKLEGDRSQVPGFYNSLFGLFEEDKTKTYKKGEADKTSFGVDGYVATKVSDLESIKMDIKNGKYVINYKFGKETNPADLNSKYGRSMDIMTPEEVRKTSIGLISDITMQYYGGFLTAEIDIATGRLTYMKMGSHVDAEVNKSKPNKAFTVKDIVSIATYTDFKW